MAYHSHSRRFLKMFVLCFAKAAHLQCLERWLISSTRRWLSDKAKVAKVTELIGCKSANKSAGRPKATTFAAPLQLSVCDDLKSRDVSFVVKGPCMFARFFTPLR